MPYVENKTVQKIERNNYYFNLEVNGFNKFSILWYVYRDGYSYESFHVSDGSTDFTYEFNEPGSYAVLYRIYDSYMGEIEHSYFTAIDIK